MRCNTACRSELPGCCVFSVCELLCAATNCNRPMPTRLVVALLLHTVILPRVVEADTVLRALLAVLELLAPEARRVYRPLSTLRHGAPHHTHTQHTQPPAGGTELPGMACGARNERQITLTPTTHTPQHPPHSPPRRQTVIARRQRVGWEVHRTDGVGDQGERSGGGGGRKVEGSGDSTPVPPPPQRRRNTRGAGRGRGRRGAWRQLAQRHSNGTRRERRGEAAADGARAYPATQMRPHPPTRSAGREDALPTVVSSRDRKRSAPRAAAPATAVTSTQIHTKETSVKCAAADN